MDGNKRTAYVLMKLILLENGLDIVADQEDKYKMVISASTGNTDLVSVLVQSALRLIVLNSYSLGIYHCMISSTTWTKLK